MLFEGEATFASPISGGNSFAAQFERRARLDSEGRSLRQLDLETRLFRYPLSYLVYSDAFDALLDVLKTQMFRRFNEMLDVDSSESVVARLDSAERVAILAILKETRPAFAAAVQKTTQRSDTIHASR